MAEEFTGTPDQIALVTSLVEDSYVKFVRLEVGKGGGSFFRPDALILEGIHKGAFCVGVNGILIDRMKKQGYNPQRRVFDLGGDNSYHEFSELNGWVVDSTWQQFLPGERHSLFRRLLHLRAPKLPTPPKVLIVRGNELPATLTSYGIKPHQIKYWTEAVLTK